MTLSPETVEVWARLRRLSSMASDLESGVVTLRSELSGFTAYDDFVQNRTSFDNLETELKTRYSSNPDYQDADITSTVDLLRDNFTDWSTYQSDVSADAVWDDYRTTLTNAGISSVNADRHIQLLQVDFTPGETFANAISNDTSWDDVNTYLTNNGFTQQEADATIAKLKDIYASFSDFQTAVTDADYPLNIILSDSPHSSSMDSSNPDKKAGVKIYDEAGTTLDNVSIPAGGVEVRGTEIHFSEIGAPTDEAAFTDISYGTIQTDDSDNIIESTDTIQVHVDITNNGSVDSGVLSVPLMVNGERETARPVTLDAGQTRNVAFDWSPDGYGEYELRIGQSGTVTVASQPAGIL